MSKLVIGTRASQLALWQARHVQSLLESQFSYSVELKKISTKGDRILDRSLMDIGGKGLFLKEIEEELLAGTVDIAVHSMKDVPYELPDGLAIHAILNREDPSDAFVSRNYSSIQNLPEGAVVGTSSLRRTVQLKKEFPKLQFKSLRGNVDSRLKKLDAGEYDAIVLASAGLIRLGWGDQITERLGMVAAVGQGAVGIECQGNDKELLKVLSALNHGPTSQAVELERYYLNRLQGSCQTPLGCHVTAGADDTDMFQIRCFYANPDGTGYFLDSSKGKWSDGEQLVDDMVKEIQKNR